MKPIPKALKRFLAQIKGFQMLPVGMLQSKWPLARPRSQKDVLRNVPVYKRKNDKNYDQEWNGRVMGVVIMEWHTNHILSEFFKNILEENLVDSLNEHVSLLVSQMTEPNDRGEEKG